jgi:hypothetical protein
MEEVSDYFRKKALTLGEVHSLVNQRRAEVVPDQKCSCRGGINDAKLETVYLSRLNRTSQIAGD